MLQMTARKEKKKTQQEQKNKEMFRNYWFMIKQIWWM